MSIITRSYKTSELKGLISNVNMDLEIDKEIIAVCNVDDYKLENTKIIIENSNRFEARITGIKHANYDKILLLDSDQVPAIGLLYELDNRKEDMVIIPERSFNNNFTGKCLNNVRYRNETLARKDTKPSIPVIPRFYKRKYLLNAIIRLPSNVYKIISHEDSILYYEVFKETQNIGFSKGYIYNYDPDLLTLMKKAFLYGKYLKETRYLEIPDEISSLIDKLNKNALNIKELGMDKGFIIQTLRGCMYELGSIIG